MSVPLAPTTEQRIAREMARGIYRGPDEVVNRALDLLESQEEWFSRNKEALHDLIEERLEALDRGEFHTPEEARAILAKAREERAALTR